MKMKKSKELILKIHPKMFASGIPSDIRKKVKRLVKIELKELKQHFKKDKWPLTKDFIEETIINKLIGSNDIIAYIDALLLEGLGEGYVISYGHKSNKGDYESDVIRRKNTRNKDMGFLVRSLHRDSKKTRKGK